MVMLFEGTEKQYSMDGYLKSNLDIAKHVIKKDWDMIFCVDGNEGAGKSVLAFQMATYCDPNFNINNVAFNQTQFRRLVVVAKPYSSVVYDEAYTGLNSRSAMSAINKILVQMLAEIRQKNLFIFVVMPTFFDLDKYVALWRSRALIHVYTGEGFQRGFFSFYNADKKKELYILGKKFYSYGQPKPNFIGRFANHYTIPEQEYRKLKAGALIKREEDRAITEAKKQFEEELLIHLQTFNNIPNTTKAKILGISEQYYYIKLKQLAAKEETKLMLEDIEGNIANAKH